MGKLLNRFFGWVLNKHLELPVAFIIFIIVATIAAIIGELWRAHILFDISFNGIMFLWY